MSREVIRPVQQMRGSVTVPGDKSISHRGLIFGALAQGQTVVHDRLKSGDVDSTARCLAALGVSITETGRQTVVEGVGLRGFSAPSVVLDCGNSGTTMRLLMGVLAGQNFRSVLTGDDSLVRRPMKRVAAPLTEMGAQFELTNQNFAPLTVVGRELKGITYDLKVSSAQIKTAILLAGLGASHKTTITGSIQSRDHTERMLRLFGINVEVTPTAITIAGGQTLTGTSVQVPGDPSTAAFWMAAAALVPGAEITVKNLSLNPTRTGFLEVLKAMGSDVHVSSTVDGFEPVGDVHVQNKRGELRGISVGGLQIPALIDEIPILAVLATQAHGETRITGAEELRVKESDRLEAVALNLRAMGIEVTTLADGLVINGPQKLRGASIKSFHDHRIAMAFSIAGLIAQGETVINDAECVQISYPDFFTTLRELTRDA